MNKNETRKPVNTHSLRQTEQQKKVEIISRKPHDGTTEIHTRRGIEKA